MRDPESLQAAGKAFFVVAACGALLLCWHETAAAQQRAPWVAIEVQGQATQQAADGSAIPIAQGATLAEGAPVKTGDDGRLVVAHEKDILTALPLSEFAIPRDADPATGPSILQRLGTLLFNIEHTPGRRFEVQAPYLAAVVKGTVFTVNASDSEASVHVAEGAVEVTASQSHEMILLHPGQTARVASSGGNLSVVGAPNPDAKPQPHSENGHSSTADDRVINPASPSAEKGTEARLTRTLGDVHPDVSALTMGLVTTGAADPPSPDARTSLSAGAAAGADADAASGAPTAGESQDSATANKTGLEATADNPGTADGNPNAAGGNPNGAGGNLNAAGGNLNSAKPSTTPAAAAILSLSRSHKH